MSVDLHAFVSHESIPDRNAWEKAIAALGISLSFHPEFDPAVASGFCPMTLGELKSGCEVECGLETVASLSESYGALRVLDPDQAVITFRWGGRFEEGACGNAAAAGLVSGFGAAVFDPQAGAFTDLDTLVQGMRGMLQYAVMFPARTVQP